MSNRGMAVLGLRLFALYLLVHALLALPQTYAFWVAAPALVGMREFWLNVGVQLAPVVFALVIWCCAGPLASLVLPQRTAAPARAPQPGDWFAPAFAAVGLLITADALPALLELAAAAQRQSAALEPVGAELTVALTAAALRLLLGVGALLGCHGLAGLIVRLRTAGAQHALSS